MKKNNSGWCLVTLSILLAVYAGWFYVAYRMQRGITATGFFLSIFLTICTFVALCAVIELIWRHKNGVDLLATLETDPEKVKEHMLFIMQWGHPEGIVGAMREFNEIFRNYPEWNLHRWEVFRAWYKHEIDHMTEKPDIYVMKMKADGSSYIKENDPLYDSDAPDWDQFDRDHSHDYDDDEALSDSSPNHKTAATDGFMMGVGFGAADNILNK